MEGEEDGFLVNTNFMKPNFEKTLVLTIKESITCCGFLGGDRIVLLTDKTKILSLFSKNKAILPYSERSFPINSLPDEIKKRYIKIFGKIIESNDSNLSDSEFMEIIERINNYLWFSDNTQLFRFKVEFHGEISNFLKNIYYKERLSACLHWWLLNEATIEEKKLFSSKHENSFYLPEDEKKVLKAIYLYNHGTYELSGL